MQKVQKIKVDKGVKPLPYTKRYPVHLVVGKKYYVSFGNNIALSCVLDEIDERGRLTVSVTRYVTLSGEVINSKHSLLPDEIGDTPEQAVLHEVTF